MKMVLFPGFNIVYGEFVWENPWLLIKKFINAVYTVMEQLESLVV